VADVARRLAGQRREIAVIAAYELTAALVAVAGSAPPATDAFVLGWVRSHLLAPEANDPVPDRLRDDPMLPALLPRLFEGRLDRAMLLDGCVGRLRRGDRPAALRAFVALLDGLAPTVEEAAARALDLVRLLPDAPSTVVAQAQKLLRQVDDAGRLEVDTLLEVSEQVLTHTEKGLVKTQLRWLGAVAKRVPERAGEIAGVVSVACDHPAADIQELARGLGGEPLSALEPWLGEAPVATPAAAMPAPVASAGELAEEVVALFSAPLSVVGFERVLAGLVAVRATDPDGVAELLTPMLHRLNPTSEFDEHSTGVWMPLTEALWPAVLPGHRDVVAAWALPTGAATADEDQAGPRELLPLLAECTGPVGPALTIALAYGLAARATANRVAAVDAVLALAGSLDPRAARPGGRRDGRGRRGEARPRDRCAHRCRPRGRVRAGACRRVLGPARRARRDAATPRHT
jgi:hypothetical protein